MSLEILRAIKRQDLTPVPRCDHPLNQYQVDFRAVSEHFRHRQTIGWDASAIATQVTARRNELASHLVT